MNRAHFQGPWQEIAHSLRPVLRRTLKRPARAESGAEQWLPGVLLSAVAMWPQLPSDEQEVLHDALARVAGLVLAHQGRQTPAADGTWPPCAELTTPVL